DVTISLEDLVADEDVMKIIRRKFGKTSKPLEHAVTEGKLVLSLLRQSYECTFPKSQYLDTVEICEEDARSRKLLKKGCERIEVTDIVTEPSPESKPKTSKKTG
ncbi:MAG: hypothetical protein JXK04_00360, partial [Campylobacterales bacterium]|nr:hypothetical protein [Campylobacterales bacterium]